MPPHPDRFEVARVLRRIAQLLRIRNESPFRARAYERGAEAIEGFAGDWPALASGGRLDEIRGIGPGLARVIAELYEEGRSSLLDSLQGSVPRGAVELSRLRSLSVAKMAALEEALGVDTLAALEAACEAGRVREVRGFGPKTEARLLEEIRRLRDGRGVLLLHRALQLGDRLLRHLRGGEGIAAAEAAGELRRRCETISRLEVVATGASAAAAIERFSAFPSFESVDPPAARAATARLADGFPVELTWAPPEEYALTLLVRTGAEAHVKRLEQGPTRVPRLGAQSPAAVPDDEALLYARLGWPFFPPEVREDAGEIEAALAGDRFQDLLTAGDIQGMVHCHTRYSDGRNTVLEMARAAEALGMKYITITDHSPTASYAGGLDLDRLERQWEEIARAQEKVGLRILRGTESDILRDGSLDYPDRVLEQLDVIVASVHERHRMSEDEMTRRLVRALSMPVFKIWGHAQGRLIGRRPPFECRMEEVLDAAARSRAAIEVNGDPHRLDMQPRWIRAARERGLRFVISVDAHSTGELGNIRYGVDIARRGWVRKREVLNALLPEHFARAVRPA
jgi:DNA polymerase (family X)